MGGLGHGILRFMKICGMVKSVDIGQNYVIANLSKYAEKVETKDGNVYYRFPYWFQQLPGNFEFVIHIELPEDLDTFLMHAVKGSNHPQPIPPEVRNEEKNYNL